MNQEFVEIRRIGVTSCAKIVAVLYGIMGLFFGVIISLGNFFSHLVGGPPSSPEVPFIGAFLGIGAIVFMPVSYGVLGGVFAAIGALLYNFCVGLVGGISVRLEARSDSYDGNIHRDSGFSLE